MRWEVRVAQTCEMNPDSCSLVHHRWQRYENHSLSPALITKAHAEWGRQTKGLQVRLCRGFFCVPVVCQPKPRFHLCHRLWTALGQRLCRQISAVTHTPLSFMYSYASTLKNDKAEGGGRVVGWQGRRGGRGSRAMGGHEKEAQTWKRSEMTALSCQRAPYVGQKHYITLLYTNPDFYVLQRQNEKILSPLYDLMGC